MTIAASGAFDPQGPVARAIDGLWWLMLVLGAATFAIFAVLLAVGLLRRAGERDDSGHDRPGRFILLGGVALPAVVLSVVMVMTVRTMAAMPWAAPDGALAVEVVGHRWWYEVRYPEQGVVTANEIHLPAGRPVAFRLTSADVIHSFWIPELGGKMDLLPEDENTLVLEADRPGVYRSQCAEFCGLQHAKMALVAVVEPQDEFDAWLARQQGAAAPPQSPAAERGRSVFLSAGCGSCHTVRGTEARGSGGPDLTHLAGRRTLAAGTIPNTAGDLRRWLADPHDIKEGVGMPALDAGEQQLAALVAYLEGLR